MGELNLIDLTAAPARRVLIVPRDDLPEDGALALRCAALGADLTTATAPGYAAAMLEPHNSVVPPRVIDAIAGWLTAAHASASPRTGTSSAATRETLLTEASDATARDSVVVRERPLFLDANERLFGVLTEPANGVARDTAIVLANAGAVPRAGPNRLYVAMAREWAARGFRVVRFDIGGIGDSVAAPGVPENHTYAPTAVPDIEEATRALRQLGAQRFVVAGLCSGAHAAFHVGVERADLPGLAGIILINPIVFYWKPGDSLDVSAWQNYVDVRRYQLRATSPEAWRRVFRGEVDALTVARTMLRRSVTVAKAAIARRIATRSTTGNLAADLLALTARPVHVVMVFSDGDPGLDQLHLHAGHALRALGKRENFRLERIANADHTFTQLPAQSALRTLLIDHVTRCFA
jgi:hypothetical protein